MKSWIPWRYLVGRIARRRGFLDPFTILARMRQFSQPSEVQEPIELIRAGVAFHARGLVNTKVLQHNLDWIWPYWAARQFDPNDPSFLPRAFSITHVNLTHRNWTALGLPGMAVYPIVDPRGLVTPFLDGWSLDWWFVPTGSAPPLFPSQSTQCHQELRLKDGLEVVTRLASPQCCLQTRASVGLDGGDPGLPELRLAATIESDLPGVLVLAIRPANPEGISFIDTITHSNRGLSVNDGPPLQFDSPPDRWLTSTYAQGDVARRLASPATMPKDAKCPAGLATAAVLFQVQPGHLTHASARLVLPSVAPETAPSPRSPSLQLWSKALARTPGLRVPNERWQFLHDAALRTVLLLSPGDIYPGPYTYRRFWFRDACLILNALIAINELDRARQVLESFPRRQQRDGYFHSQEGEWDANGQVLWIADRLERATGRLLPSHLWASLIKGANWIPRKCTRAPGKPHDGLLPPGFSAEHLGPNDYYYWDDLWGLAGLQAAARMARRRGDQDTAAAWEGHAATLTRSLQQSFDQLPIAVATHGVPASPYRRMDSGAIGSMVADYPLQLDELGRERFTRTADWLERNCLQQGGFFQDMIHSGINAYLTLDLAQTFLRNGDPRWFDLTEAIAVAASPTGQWPEAIHPRTGGGCMGDGQHAWAAAEWLLMMRSLFVREETDHLVIGSGLPAAWFQDSTRDVMFYGPTATPWGSITVSLRRTHQEWRLLLEANWHGAAPRLRIRIPGYEPLDTVAARFEVRLHPVENQPAEIRE